MLVSTKTQKITDMTIIPNFQEVMHLMLSIRDQTLANPHQLLIGNTEADANTAGAVLQADGTNPRIDLTDRGSVESLIGDMGPGESLMLSTEYWAVRYSLNGLDESFFRKSKTYWIKFDGETRLTKAKQVARDRRGNTSIIMYMEISERL